MADYLPLDTTQWDRAAASAYGLEKFLYRQGPLELRLSRVGPKKPWVSNPYGYVGGLEGISEQNCRDMPEALSELLAQSDAPYALIRTIEPLPDTVVHRFRVETHFRSFYLDLDGGADHVWKNKLASKVRRQTRRGLRMGLDTRIGHLELFDDFFKVLAHCWRDLGTPFHKANYFRSLLENYGPESSAIVNLYAGSEPVSTALLLTRGTTVFHPYTGTIRPFQKDGANNVLYWKIIEWACGEGYLWFDMGRSRFDQSTARYKRPWGVEERTLHYNYLLAPGARVREPQEVPWVKYAVNAWKTLPVWLSKTLGPVFIKDVL